MGNQISNQSEPLADRIIKRANALNVSIAKLCRDAGVSRRWFEYLKRRTPKAVVTYMKIDRQLTELENERKGAQSPETSN